MPSGRSRTQWKKKLDLLWSKIIRFPQQCERCGARSGVQFQAAHIAGRVKLNTRFDLENGLCLCAKCHRWGHDYPNKFTWWLEDYLGKEFLEELNARAEIKTYGKFDYEATDKYLKDIWDGLNN